ncbi:MAG: DMT family transporter, partial [Pseudomonadota bacterium]
MRNVVALSDQSRGLAWIALGGLLFVAFMVLVRLVSLSLHPIQAAFIRYAFGLLLILPLVWRQGARLFESRRVLGHAVRGVAHGAGVLLWFFAISRLPLADITALSFTSPLYVLLGAWLFLGERLTGVRIASVMIGLVGVMLILRPGWVPIGAASVAMLLAAPLFAVSKLL